MRLGPGMINHALFLSFVTCVNAQCSSFTIPNTESQTGVDLYNSTRAGQNIRASPALTCSQDISDCTVPPEGSYSFGNSSSCRNSLFGEACSNATVPGCLLRGSGSLTTQAFTNISTSLVPDDTDINNWLDPWLWQVVANGITKVTGNQWSGMLYPNISGCVDSSLYTECLQVGRSGYLQINRSWYCAVGTLAGCHDDAAVLEGKTIEACGVLREDRGTNGNGDMSAPEGSGVITYVSPEDVAALSENPAQDGNCTTSGDSAAPTETPTPSGADQAQPSSNQPSGASIIERRPLAMLMGSISSIFVLAFWSWG